MIRLHNSRGQPFKPTSGKNKMRATVSVEHLVVDKVLYDFVNHEAIPGTGVQERPFWSGFCALVRALAPRNSELLLRRDELQSKIDAWHRQSPGAAFDRTRYKEYLLEIGYLVPEKQPFAVDTAAVDPEIAQIAGPQLVVPVSNARYALNAANARWGSLYDSLYGTDAIPEDGAPRAGSRRPDERRRRNRLERGGGIARLPRRWQLAERAAAGPPRTARGTARR